ncbi:MAG: DUF1731 domain-containing protein, partial [Deltaproteobacteria bacterium]
VSRDAERARREGPVAVSRWVELHTPEMAEASWFHPPAWLVRLMVGEASCLLLESQRALPRKALGFTFHYPELDAALESIAARLDGDCDER